MTREVMQQALKALSRYQSNLSLTNNRQDTEAITALKEALAQPVQEPPQYSLKAHWTDDKRIGVVACVVRPDGGVHLMQTIIDPPLPVQRCALCNYQHGHQIGCKNNPVDIALANLAQPPTASRRTHEH